MRVLVGVLALSLCAAVSSQRLEHWRSDRALWTAAVRVSPSLPSAALMLGSAYVRHGDWAQGAEWTLRAATLAASRPEPTTFLDAIRSQAHWIDAFLPVCHLPAWQRVCA